MSSGPSEGPRNVDELLFGDAAASWLEPLRGLVPTLIGYRYTFMPDAEYAVILSSNVSKGMEIYWRELLYRAHFAAAGTLLRFERWLSGSIDAYHRGNLFAFAACLRGVLESAADSYDTLRVVPTSLADAHVIFKRALAGNLKDVRLHPELESCLIHFSHARRLEKGENAPPAHRAKTSAEYLRQFGSLSREAGTCYTQLCQITHPAADSLTPFLGVSHDGTTLELLPSDQAQDLIAALTTVHRAAMLPLFSLCLVPAIMTLQVLNRLPLASVHTRSADKVDLSWSPAWGEILGRLANSAEPNVRVHALASPSLKELGF